MLTTQVTNIFFLYLYLFTDYSMAGFPTFVRGGDCTFTSTKNSLFKGHSAGHRRTSLLYNKPTHPISEGRSSAGEGDGNDEGPMETF